MIKFDFSANKIILGKGNDWVETAVAYVGDTKDIREKLHTFYDFLLCKYNKKCIENISNEDFVSGGLSVYKELILAVAKASELGDPNWEVKYGFLKNCFFKYELSANPEDFHEAYAYALDKAMDDVFIEITNKDSENPNFTLVRDETSTNNKLVKRSKTEMKATTKNSNYEPANYTDCMEYQPDMVNHPPHYEGEVECIDCIESATEGLSGIESYDTGTAIKYLFRWKKKNGVEDLKKAIWYINHLIKLVENN